MVSNNSFVFAKIHFLSRTAKSLPVFYGFCRYLVLKTASGLMCASPFQKRHKRRKAHGDHDVSEWHRHRRGHFFLCACAERTSPFYPFSFSRLLLAAEKPPDAGHDKRESAPATISGCHVFPVLKPSCRAFARRGKGRQDRLKDKCRRKNTCKRKPCTHDNDACRTSVTAAWKRGFPLCPLRRALNLPRGALRHPQHFLLFLSASPASMPMFPCRHSRRHP